MNRYKIHKLKNHLTVIVCYYPNFNSLYFDLAVKVGSRYENKNNNGLAHLTEHILSKKVIDSSQKHSWIKSYISDNFEAYTLQERTNFEFSAHKNDIETGVKFLAKILQSATITKKDVEIEKNIILEELLEKEAEHDFIYNQTIGKLCYKNNPLGFETSGIKSNIKKFTLKDVRNFINQYYRPENIILTMAGNVNDQQLIPLIYRYFKFARTAIKGINNFQGYIYPGDNIHIIKNQAPQNYFGYYYPVFNFSIEENVKWEFFTEILNNYLFYTITNKLFCYSIRAEFTTYIDFASFSIESSFNPSKTVQFYLLLQKTLRQFKKSLDSGGLNYYKNKKIKNLDLDKDYPRESANAVGWYALMFGTDQIMTLSDQQKIIQAITLKDIYNYFDRLFQDNRGTVTIGGKVLPAQQQQFTKIWNNWKI